MPDHPSADTSIASEISLPSPVLVVEDEPLLQQRILRLLLSLGYEPEAVVLVGSLGQARTFLANEPVALALVDLALPDGNGISLIEQMRADDPAVGILVVSAWSSEDSILGALRAGANGYVLKERDDIEVSLSIRSVLRGGAPIDPFIARRILQLLPTAAAPVDSARAVTTGEERSAVEALTRRETQILHLVVDGMTNQEIADSVCLSRFTVDCHVKRIYRKLAVSSRVKAVREARLRGLIL